MEVIRLCLRCENNCSLILVSHCCRWLLVRNLLVWLSRLETKLRKTDEDCHIRNAQQAFIEYS